MVGQPSCHHRSPYLDRGVVQLPKKKKRRTGRDRRLRLRLFRAGNTRCPICLSEFTRSDVASGKVTLEHAPPKALKGSAICLTCRECNNNASRIDQHAILAQRAHDEWSSGRGTRVEIDFGGLKKSCRYLPSNPRALLPTRVADLRKGSLKLGALPTTAHPEINKGIRFRIPRQPHYESISMIKSAYLMVFSVMGEGGYRYCRSAALEPVREQIMNPREAILTGMFVANGTILPTAKATITAVFLCHAARPPLWVVPMSNGKTVLLPCGGPVPVDEIVVEGNELTIANKHLTGWLACRFDESAQISGLVSRESGIADGNLVGTTGAPPIDGGGWEWMVVDHHMERYVALPCHSPGEAPSPDSLNVVAMHGSHAVEGRGMDESTLSRVNLGGFRNDLTIHRVDQESSSQPMRDEHAKGSNGVD